MQTKYFSATPLLMSFFFLHVSNDEIEKKHDSYAKFHGDTEDVEVVFFEDVPGKCARKITADSSRFGNVKSYSFSNEITDDEYVQRKLLVTVEF